MKKKIIITALSVMLASTSIVPAYAALPEGAPAVEESYEVHTELYKWADQYTEELKGIEDSKSRYQRMYEIIFDNWSIAPDGMYYRDDFVNIYNQGMLPGSTAAEVVCYWGSKIDNSNISLAVVWIDGAPFNTSCITIDGVNYYAQVGTYANYGYDIKYLYGLPGEYGMEVRAEGTEPENVDTEYHWYTNLRNTGWKVIYDKDNTWEKVDLVHKTTEEIEAMFSANHIFHICENGILTPITREEAVALGYNGNR